MVSCLISRHCLFEKTFLLNKIRVTIHYLPFHPVIEISLEYPSGFGLGLYSGKFEYKSEPSYDSFLEFVFDDEEDDLAIAFLP